MSIETPEPLTTEQARDAALEILSAHLNEDTKLAARLTLEAVGTNKISAALVTTHLVFFTRMLLEWQARERGTTPLRLFQELALADRWTRLNIDIDFGDDEAD